MNLSLFATIIITIYHYYHYHSTLCVLSWFLQEAWWFETRWKGSTIAGRLRNKEFPPAPTTEHRAQSRAQLKILRPGAQTKEPRTTRYNWTTWCVQLCTSNPRYVAPPNQCAPNSNHTPTTNPQRYLVPVPPSPPSAPKPQPQIQESGCLMSQQPQSPQGTFCLNWSPT